MNPPPSMADKTGVLARSVRIYRRLLRLYPREHRGEYGEWMCQLFRDQCRDARREAGAAGVRAVWRRALPDLVFTAVREHFFEIKRRKNMNCMNVRNRPLLLMAAGLGAGFLSLGFLGGPWAVWLAALSAVAIGAKAAVEFFGPSVEWKRVMWSAFVVMFCYALFMPAWGKSGMVPANQGPWSPLNYFTVLCLMANPVVALIKAGQFLLERRKR